MREELEQLQAEFHRFSQILEETTTKYIKQVQSVTIQKESLDQAEISLKEREETLVIERDLLEKEKIALRERAIQLDVKEKDLTAKRAQVQSLLTSL